MDKYIERFDTKYRVLHWFVTISFFVLVLSGMGLYSRLFTSYFNLFGGGRTAILFHKAAGILFFFSSVVLFLSHKKDILTFDKDDRDWLIARGGYLSRKEPHLQIGKLNAGQKIFGIFIAAATLSLGFSGMIIWVPFVFPRLMVQISLLLHGLSFVLSVMFVIVHIYLSTLGNPGTIEGMLWGSVRSSWAKKHSPKWYREMSGQK